MLPPRRLPFVSELRDAVDGDAVGGADCTPKNVISATTASAIVPTASSDIEDGPCSNSLFMTPVTPSATRRSSPPASASSAYDAQGRHLVPVAAATATACAPRR